MRLYTNQLMHTRVMTTRVVETTFDFVDRITLLSSNVHNIFIVPILPKHLHFEKSEALPFAN